MKYWYVDKTAVEISCSDGGFDRAADLQCTEMPNSHQMVGLVMLRSGMYATDGRQLRGEPK
jgi:hypothetical protein